MATTSRYLIDSPPPPPAPRGLFDACVGPAPFPVAPAMGNGVEWVEESCGDGYLYPLTYPAPSGTKTFDPIGDTVNADPFAVYASQLYPPVGYTLPEIEARVLRRLALTEQRVVERRLWQGGGGVTGLFRAPTVTTLSAASCPAVAMAALEQALADAGVVGGLLHARVTMASQFAAGHLLERGGGGRPVTPYGTTIVFGAGYDGTGPTGNAVSDTTEWVYATGRVHVYRDDPWVPPLGEVLNRSTNQLYALAERIYAVGVECGVWAIQVTRDCVTAGAA